MRGAAVILALAGLLHFSPCAYAVNPDEILKDPALETRARQISSELRCLVCQNQSIDISDADLARDLRVIVRERLSAGDTDAQVFDFVVARYGQFVLLKPRFSAENALLWGAPLVFVFIGALVMFTKSRRSSKGQEPVALSADEQAQLAEIMKQSGPQ